MRGASALLERNTLRDGAGAGLLVEAGEAGGGGGGGGGGGVARRNAIHGHAGANVQLSSADGALLLEGIEIHSGGGAGMLEALASEEELDLPLIHGKVEEARGRLVARRG